MRAFTAGIFTTLIFAIAVPCALPGDKASKDSKKVIGPRQGIKTPGIQIPFTNLSPEATIPAGDKPAWVFFRPDAPAGGGGAAAGGGGGRGRGGGRGGGGGNAAPGAAPAPANGTLFLPAKDKLERIETKTNKALDAITGLKQPCGGMVFAFASLWAPTCGDGALQRIDAKTAKITATMNTGAADIHGSIAASSDSIWLLTDTRETLARIDPEQNVVVGEIRLPAGCMSLLFAETSLWLACPEQNRVLRINTATNVVDKRIETAGRPLALAAGENSIWVLCGKDGKVDRIDPKTDKVSKSIDLMTPNVDGGLAFGDGFVWVTASGFPLTRIDPTAETVAQQFWGDGAGAITASAGALWLSRPAAANVLRIDPKLVLATLAE